MVWEESGSTSAQAVAGGDGARSPVQVERASPEDLAPITESVFGLLRGFLKSHRQIDGTRLLERVVDDQDALAELDPAHASREIDDRAFERLGEGGCGWTLGGLDPPVEVDVVAEQQLRQVATKPPIEKRVEDEV